MRSAKVCKRLRGIAPVRSGSNSNGLGEIALFHESMHYLLHITQNAYNACTPEKQIVQLRNDSSVQPCHRARKRIKYVGWKAENPLFWVLHVETLSWWRLKRIYMVRIQASIRMSKFWNDWYSANVAPQPRHFFCSVAHSVQRTWKYGICLKNAQEHDDIRYCDHLLFSWTYNIFNCVWASYCKKLLIY